MRFLLIIHTDPATWDGLADAWRPEDLAHMIDYNRRLDARLRETGELLDENGFGGPALAKTVRAADGSEGNGTQPKPIVTDGLRPGAKDFLVGYWLIDVASPERAYEIAAKISATPGPGGTPLDQPVEVHPVAAPPLTS
jgi:hypothetical protein